MSDFNHTVSVQYQGDDGTIIQMSNTYTVEGVLHFQDGNFIQGLSGADPILSGPPPCELPQFVMASAKRYPAQITVENAGAQSLPIDLRPGWVYISPDGSSLIVDANAAAVTAATQMELLSIDNSPQGASLRVTSLNTLAS